jgi:hypothetical protein
MEEKIRIILEGLRRETPMRDLCRWEGIRTSICYAWLKDLMKAGKRHLQPEKGSSYQLASGLTQNGESRIFLSPKGKFLSPKFHKEIRFLSIYSAFFQAKGCKGQRYKGENPRRGNHGAKGYQIGLHTLYQQLRY